MHYINEFLIKILKLIISFIVPLNLCLAPANALELDKKWHFANIDLVGCIGIEDLDRALALLSVGAREAFNKMDTCIIIDAKTKVILLDQIGRDYKKILLSSPTGIEVDLWVNGIMLNTEWGFAENDCFVRSAECTPEVRKLLNLPD